MKSLYLFIVVLLLSVSCFAYTSVEDIDGYFIKVNFEWYLGGLPRSWNEHDTYSTEGYLNVKLINESKQEYIMLRPAQAIYITKRYDEDLDDNYINIQLSDGTSWEVSNTYEFQLSKYGRFYRGGYKLYDSLGGLYIPLM